MKKKKIIIAVIFVAACFIFTLFLKPCISKKVHKKYMKNTFLSYLSKERFNSQLKNYPKWMDDQINEDFVAFNKIKITQKAMNETFQTIMKTREKDKVCFLRFRIIDNNMYMYIPDEKRFPKRQTTFERSLRTLRKTTQLPDVDIIYSDEDGTTLFWNPSNFFVTDDFSDQAPLLSRAKTQNLNYVVLIPDYHDLSDNNTRLMNKVLKLNDMYPWNKKANQAFWRGINRRKSRYTLSVLSYENPSLINAGFPGKIDEVNNELENPYISVDHLIKIYASLEEHFEYKYQMVMDGFFCTYPGYKWRLLSNCLALKQESNQVQWYYRALKPYEHYIPVNNDMSDLLEKINFAIKNDELCRKISQNATDFVLNNLNIENVYVYLYKILKTHEKAQAFNRKDLIKDTKNNPKWICINNRKLANQTLKRKGFTIY